jgi:diaminohydroxyphosphoribosylaminopyrimidine deaminase/5-amino-6-(5-phosphoribosylamino)uracil reductase
VVTRPADGERLDLRQVMAYLAQQEINEVLLESGAVLAGAMLAEGLIDELVVYLAPHLMGSSARGLFNLPAIELMSQRIGLKITDLRQIGEDIRITAAPQQE